MPRKRLRELASPLEIASKLAPESLVSAWLSQLERHGAGEPVWLQRSLLPGSIVGDTLALLSNDLGSYAGVELWAQRRDVRCPMHLHFDCDEESGRVGRPLSTPMHSAILYVSSCGGPTLLLEHRPADAWSDSVRCHACWPRAGQCMAFPGDWMHGVLVADDLIDQGAAGEAETRERVTVVLNLWRRRPLAVPGLRASDVPPSACDFAGESASAATPRVFDWDQATSGGGGAGGGGDEVSSGRSGWRWRALTTGMFERTSTIELCMPPITFRGYQLESFTCGVRNIEVSSQAPCVVDA